MCVSLEEFLTVTGAHGQQLSEAQTRTPLLGPSGPACTLQFSYSLSGSNPHIGTTSAVIHLSHLCKSVWWWIIDSLALSAGDLAVYVVDSVLGTHPVLWEFSGRTNETAGTWVKEEIYVGARDNRFQGRLSSCVSSFLSVSLFTSIYLSIYLCIYLSFYLSFFGTQRRRSHFFSPSSPLFSLLALCLVSSHLLRDSLCIALQTEKIMDLINWSLNAMTPSSRREAWVLGTWLPWRNVCSWLHDGRVERVAYRVSSCSFRGGHWRYLTYSEPW